MTITTNDAPSYVERYPILTTIGRQPLAALSPRDLSLLFEAYMATKAAFDHVIYDQADDQSDVVAHIADAEGNRCCHAIDEIVAEIARRPSDVDDGSLFFPSILIRWAVHCGDYSTIKKVAGAFA